MSLLTIQIMKAPWYLLTATLIAITYSVLMLHFDQIIFFVPYFVINIHPVDAWNFVLDISLAILTGTVLAISISQIKLRGGSRPAKSARSGVIGALVAIFAGACPCYYLVPLLATAGALGGTLGAVGIMLNTYQVPVKLASLTMLVAVAYGLEASMRRPCAIPIQVTNQKQKI